MMVISSLPYFNLNINIAEWYVYLIISFVAVIYLGLIYVVIREPTSLLTPVDKEHEEDDVGKKIVIKNIIHHNIINIVH